MMRNQQDGSVQGKPSLCCISYQQLLDVDQQVLTTFGATKYPTVTMRDVVRKIIQPHCQATGKSYAESLNPDGLLPIDAFVTHSWDGSFAGFVDAIKSVFQTRVKKPNLWICSFCILQGDQETVSRQLQVPSIEESPFVQALECASSFCVVRNCNTDLYSRIWCVCELMVANKEGLFPSRTHVTGPKDAFAQLKTSCLDAQATYLKDRERILTVLLNEHRLEEIDEIVQLFRTHDGPHSPSTTKTKDNLQQQHKENMANATTSTTATMNMTDQAARVEFAKQGLCPDHPWVQLRKKNFFGRWKTILVTCPHHGEGHNSNGNRIDSSTMNHPLQLPVEQAQETCPLPQQHINIPTTANTAPATQSQSQPHTATTVPVNPLFESIWGNIDADLQDAFALAGAAARREGKNYISTTQLFSALRRLAPSTPLAEFFDRLPDGALPDSTPEAIPVEVQALEDISSLSPCVNSALENLSTRQHCTDMGANTAPMAHATRIDHQHAAAGGLPNHSPKLLSSKDVFVDIAMHGRSKSTVRLRTHGVDQAAVQDIVQQLGWQILERGA